MSPVQTEWTRLIRFIAAETSQVHIGQPIDPDLDVGLAAWKGQAVQAHEIIGSALDPAAQVTSRVLTVNRLLAPLSREELKIIRCLGLNYSDHAAESNMEKPTAPVLFYKPLSSIIGPNAPIEIPRVAQPVEDHIPDYEVELVIVIGKTAKNVSEEEALDYVLGYTAANDVSFRKHQFATSQWGFSKGFDNTNPLGPSIVSANAISNPQVLPLKFTLNRQVLQCSNTSEQIFSVRQTIAFLSQGTTLEPGSIILTGTPAGVGFTRKPPIVLKHGDHCQAWIGYGIGTLANPVMEEGKQTGARF